MQSTAIGAGGQRRRRVGFLAFVLALFLTLLFFVAATRALAQPPAVSGTAARQVHATTARLEGLVNPEGKATSYQFEYLPQVRWEEEGESFAAARVPESPAAIGAGIVGIPVAEKLNGLDPATTYRFRLLASSGEDAEGEMGTFTNWSRKNLQNLQRLNKRQDVATLTGEALHLEARGSIVFALPGMLADMVNHELQTLALEVLKPLFLADKYLLCLNEAHFGEGTGPGGVMTVDLLSVQRNWGAE